MARFFQSAVKNTIVFSAALFSAFSFAQGKLAIVIDDIGYHPKEDAEILAMPKEISVDHHSCCIPMPKSVISKRSAVN